MNKDHPLGRDFLEYQRESAKGYTCPVCDKVFSAEPKLWSHGVQIHTAYIGNLRSLEKTEAEVRKRFREDALHQSLQRAPGIQGSSIPGPTAAFEDTSRDKPVSSEEPRRRRVTYGLWSPSIEYPHRLHTIKESLEGQKQCERKYTEPTQQFCPRKDSSAIPKIRPGTKQTDKNLARAVPNYPQDSHQVESRGAPQISLGDEPELLLQPKTKPISHEQLVVEVKGIYAGLVMVEAKCIDIDERQMAAAQEQDPRRKNELENHQWQSLIALHKQLLHEHHDFFLASQHPCANANLGRLAAKYCMPARIWRHGIHAFLETLRHRLPDSVEHMLAFVYIAYSMMALLYETVGAFEDTWIELLGDLGRYRIAIEENEPRDHEVWSNVARFWYNKASDKSSGAGHLHRHLAILSRPNTLEQWLLYCRSLTPTSRLANRRGSIQLRLKATLHGSNASQRRPYKVDGFGAAISNIAALFEYGVTTSNPRIPISYKDASTILKNVKVESTVAALVMDDNRIRNSALDCSCIGLRDPAPLLAFDAADDTSPLCGPKTWLTNRLRSLSLPHSFTAPPYSVVDTSFILPDPMLALQRTNDNSKSYGISIAMKNAASRWLGFTRCRQIRMPAYVACMSFLLPISSASPLRSLNEPGIPYKASPTPFFALGYVLFALAILSLAQYLAPRKGPTRVWGCVTSGSAYAWLMVRNDPDATLVLSIPVFGVWCISTFRYGLASFERYEIPDVVSLIVLLAATILDFLIIRYMTPSEAAISQSDFISMSLPSTSLMLAIIVTLIASMKPSLERQESLLPNRDAEIDILEDEDHTTEVADFGNEPITSLQSVNNAAAELASS